MDEEGGGVFKCKVQDSNDQCRKLADWLLATDFNLGAAYLMQAMVQ